MLVVARQQLLNQSTDALPLLLEQLVPPLDPDDARLPAARGRLEALKDAPSLPPRLLLNEGLGVERLGEPRLRPVNGDNVRVHLLQERPDVHVAQHPQAKGDSTLVGDRIVNRRVQVQSEGGAHRGQVARAEDEPSVKVNREVGTGVRAAAEYIHAIVHDRSVVRVDKAVR